MPLLLHLSDSLSFLGALLPLVPASVYLWERRECGPSFHPPSLSYCSSGVCRVCDLVSHMIEICLILLCINILHWNGGDSRREGKDERQDDRGKRGIV